MTSNHIKAAADDIGEDAATSAREAGGKAEALYGRARDQFRGAADELSGRASDAIATGRHAYRESSETVSRHVSKQPIEALLLAGAIGYLVGWASNRS